jgi:hypothetical protein
MISKEKWKIKACIALFLMIYVYWFKKYFMLDVLVCITVFMEKNLCIRLQMVAYDVLWIFIMYKICIDGLYVYVSKRILEHMHTFTVI